MRLPACCIRSSRWHLSTALYTNSGTIMNSVLRVIWPMRRTWYVIEDVGFTKGRHSWSCGSLAPCGRFIGFREPTRYIFARRMREMVPLFMFSKMWDGALSR